VYYSVTLQTDVLRFPDNKIQHRFTQQKTIFIGQMFIAIRLTWRDV